jgi:hypothetical protein
LIGTVDARDRWSDPSVLPGMAVGELAAHLGRSVLQVEWFLDAPIADGELTDAVTYYARLEGTADPSSPLNEGVRARSAESAARGYDAVLTDVTAGLERLTARLPTEPADRRVAVAHRPGEEMLLDEYLRTRCVELTVHTTDLALSIGVPDPRGNDDAVTVAVDLLAAAARQRHGDRAVLTGLTRRERDDRDASRVL